MPAGKSVQFRGIDQAVEAYQNQEIPRWGLFQGSQFLCKYEGTSMADGADKLETFLKALDLRSADANTYTLCVYDDLGVNEKIKSNTKYDGSFNFRLVDNIEGYNDQRNKYEQRIAGLENTIREMNEPEDEEPATVKDQLYAGLGKILEHPQVQQLLATKFIQILDGLSTGISGIFNNKTQPMQEAFPRAAAIGATKDDENLKLEQAVNYLVTIDPLLGTHLLKLAQIAQGDPAKYQNLIGMLNFM